MIDYHIHPGYSIDAEGSVIEFCEAAISKELHEICFTTHLDCDPKREDGFVVVKGRKISVRSNTWLEEYDNEIRSADDFYSSQGLRVRLGVEVDLFPGVWELLPERFHSTSFDLIMGSVHLMDHKAISVEEEAKAIFSKMTLEEMGDRYFYLLEDCVTSGHYDIIGHIDLYKRYGEAYFGEETHNLWKSHIRSLAEKMKKNKVGFEINTSSLRKGMTEPMPEKSIVCELKKHGVETVIIGSDAHMPREVGSGIAHALRILQESGYESPFIFQNRKATKLNFLSQ